MPAPNIRNRHEAAVRGMALGYPEAHEDFPWDHRAIKVRGKTFVFLSNGEPGLSVSVKLPASAEGVLQLPYCEPTHYGLGRSGWVTATFGPRDAVPMDAIRSWIDESYRAVAPKRLVATLAPAGAAAPARKRLRPSRRPSRPGRRAE
ncbi:MmcQ/YjbR family DNA-binding protein [Anaeromyxobacter oryzae]|uniref:DifB protein n=1 Tax=Anaeromyxobacter oryzae TaxID=2918170 RepID=A0ABN6MYF1_9BACT|nr:MmcQ/YjbR family DNA-binding protein [Anaeromyxobacter oryzae]BDG05987.1 hypothetical protein AMOR_49830 [Anaeromyxobacter oryzae]